MKLRPGQAPQTSDEIAAYSQFMKTKAAVLKKNEQMKALNQEPKDLDRTDDKVAIQNTRLSGGGLGEMLQGKDKYAGFARVKDDHVVDMSVDSKPDGDGNKFRYAELEDGSKLYAAPSGDSNAHQVVLETNNGTLYMDNTFGMFVDSHISSLKDEAKRDERPPAPAPYTGLDQSVWGFAPAYGSTPNWGLAPSAALEAAIKPAQASETNS